MVAAPVRIHCYHGRGSKRGAATRNPKPPPPVLRKAHKTPLCAGPNQSGVTHRSGPPTQRAPAAPIRGSAPPTSRLGSNARSSPASDQHSPCPPSRDMAPLHPPLRPAPKRPYPTSTPASGLRGHIATTSVGLKWRRAESHCDDHRLLRERHSCGPYSVAHLNLHRQPGS